MSQRPPIHLLDAQLQAAGLQGVPEWYIRALRDPSITLVNGRPKEEFLPFSPQSMEYPIQQQWLNSGNQPLPRPAPRRRPPARRADPFMDMQMPQVAIETPEVPLPQRPVSMDDLLSPEELAANPVYDDPDTGTRLDAGLYANLPGEPNDPDRRTRQDAGLYANLPPRSVSPEVRMTDAQVRAAYPRRMTMGLTPEEIAEIERRHAAMVANPQRVASDPTSLDPNEAAAVEIGSDPPLAPQRAASTPAAASSPAENPGMDRARAGLYANLPPIEDQEAAASAAAPELPDREDWVARRAAELVRMNRPLTYRDAAMSPEMARARAEAEYDDPNGWQRNPNSTESMSPQVRAAVRRQIDIEAQQRNADMRASLGGGEQQFNARKFREEREAAEAAAQANARRKWDEWRTGGSLDRMAEYAPEEYNQRWEAAAEGRRKQNAEERAKRYTTDPNTGETVPNQAYIESQKRKDKALLRAQDPGANVALVRQLESMGIDTEQFGDPASDSFDRTSAIALKRRVMARGVASPQQADAAAGGAISKNGSGSRNPGLGGRYGAVQRDAMRRQNPWEYMGRGDINDEQRRTAAFLLSNGRGATANDVAALSAKALLQGIEVGAERGMRIGNMDAKTEIAAGQTRQQILQNAQAAANEFFRERAEKDSVFGSRGLSEESYGDLVSMLTAITGSPAMAEGIARRYRRLGGRAERTAPPST